MAGTSDVIWGSLTHICLGNMGPITSSFNLKTTLDF